MASAAPVLSVETMHDDFVHDAQLDYYARKLATCSSDRSVKVFDVADGGYTHRATLTGHEGPVWEVAWSHPRFGVLLASAGFDGRVLVHRESPPGQWIAVHLHTVEGSATSVSWAPQELGLVLAASSSAGVVSVLTHRDDDRWETATLRVSPLGCTSVSWAPFGATDDGGAPVARLVTGACDNTVKVWRQQGGGGEWQQEQSFSPFQDWVRDVAWAPSAGFSGATIAACSEDGTVVVLTQSDAGDWSSTVLHQFNAPVWRVSWSLTGAVLAVSCGDGQVTLWKQSLDSAWAQVSTVGDVDPPAAPSAS